MPIETIVYDQHALTLALPDGHTLSVQLIAFMADYVADTLDRVEITFLVDPADYAVIDEQALFNLAPDVRGPNFNMSFSPDAPIEIEARLHPDYLTMLESETESVREMGAFLLHLSRSQVDHPLLSTANWYGLCVKQEQPVPPELQRGGGSIKMGYSTTWLEGIGSSERMSAALRTLIKTLEADQWVFVREIGSAMLSSRYWDTEIDERWTVYSQIRDEETFCLIYGICPVQLFESQLSQAAEFIARANADLPIGNFELNYDKPEIRFKTSLDYEGGELTVPLVRQLLQANVAMMARYLPALRALLENNASIANALRLAEE